MPSSDSEKKVDVESPSDAERTPEQKAEQEVKGTGRPGGEAEESES